MPPSRRKKTIKCMGQKKGLKTRRRTKDIDQLYDDMQPAKVAEFQAMPLDPDLPGFGQFYCFSCGRHFGGKEVLSRHKRSKVHKQQLKKLKEEPYRGPDELVDNGPPIVRPEDE